MSTTGRKNKPTADPTGGHALAGGGPSQLSVDASMRARDVSRPTEADIDKAETTVKVSRRAAPATPASVRNP